MVRLRTGRRGRHVRPRPLVNLNQFGHPTRYAEVTASTRRGARGLLVLPKVANPPRGRPLPEAAAEVMAERSRSTGRPAVAAGRRRCCRGAARGRGRATGCAAAARRAASELRARHEVNARGLGRSRSRLPPTWVWISNAWLVHYSADESRTMIFGTLPLAGSRARSPSAWPVTGVGLRRVRVGESTDVLPQRLGRLAEADVELSPPRAPDNWG